MKLSELTKLRNELRQVSVATSKFAIDEVDCHLSRVKDLSLLPDYKEKVSELLGVIDSVEQQLLSVEQQIPIMIDDINREIQERTKEFLNVGYSINGVQILPFVNPLCEREDKVLPMHDETRSEVLVRARKYTDWRFPALEIGPGDGEWTEHLIASDPLYIVDLHQEFIDSTLKKFNPVYRNRIRPYIVGSHNISDTDLSMLPKNQFGFIFSWNVFNYFPLEYAKTLLAQCVNLLRPGGVMMFSYNNCDVYQCAEYAERGLASWMTESMLKQTCTDLGFEIISMSSTEETVHWIEIKKPGELKTIKAHQVLGEIVRR